MSTQIASFKKQADEVKARIDSSEPSLQVFAEDVLRRSLVVAAASYFEHELCEAIRYIFKEQKCSAECLALIETKALNRQFYSYFDFESSNTNKLFTSFGKECKDRASKALKEDDVAAAAQSAFLAICALRNNMVHRNFVAFPVELSTDEIYEKFVLGSNFIDFFKRTVLDVHADGS